MKIFPLHRVNCRLSSHSRCFSFDLLSFSIFMCKKGINNKQYIHAHTHTHSVSTVHRYVHMNVSDAPSYTNYMSICEFKHKLKLNFSLLIVCSTIVYRELAVINVVVVVVLVATVVAVVVVVIILVIFTIVFVCCRFRSRPALCICFVYKHLYFTL